MPVEWRKHLKEGGRNRIKTLSQQLKIMAVLWRESIEKLKNVDIIPRAFWNMKIC